ncbi:glycerol-3-phosphate dehydrogenase [Thalassobaculum litoreum]|uniref:Glycerol-3-phosphate dehydrogenase n=1 Tax=Thalassobaculum litoreum DSM 18839 TaxID=1123362 RepID=A0A8G2BN62_9PROT|nr:glycerol-3-phosphate dehydrogenase [Thalassobaculum litoreum]SDG36450.1 homodimeric glycerol 3-phosphate dehydrogenase (quinone) [Thalassobaculum litoreum DSM 18839]
MDPGRKADARVETCLGKQIFDLAIIGGGVNGCGIARDAAGRGLSVFLCEMGDLAQGTSSASTKLFHGGLRYLEYFEFRLVREALKEREVLLCAMPHIAWPLRFVLPHHRGLRPAWFLRLGLFVYDHLGGRKILPATETVDLRSGPIGASLKDQFVTGFEYSDGWVQDSRLVVLNARDAADRGASVNVRTKCLAAAPSDGVWQVQVRDEDTGATRTVAARSLVNAGGPWVGQVISQCVRVNTNDNVRLVRGSHIVVRKRFEHDRAFIFQNADKRIVFAIPYEEGFTLIGTTDRDHETSPSEAVCTPEEIEYLCRSVSEYFRDPVTAEDVVWTYSGVRPLYDDGAKSATAATRDYVLKVERSGDAPPLLNIFGGKITTYRRLAEAALEKLRPFFPQMGSTWTAGACLPGGDFPVGGDEEQGTRLRDRYGFLDVDWARRLIRTYGTDAFDLLGDAASIEDLGQNFGATLTEAEVVWLMRKEWARSASDVLWRRTKLGLRLSDEQARTLDVWMRASRADEQRHAHGSR